jgi:hypothetical protein
MNQGTPFKLRSNRGFRLRASPHISPFVGIEDWTGGRSPLALGTNAGATPLAFQNWRRFKEAFAPELVWRAVNETRAALGRPVETCLDPFSGSGTTPLTCQFLGVHPIAVEVNPFLADLTEAKLSPIDVDLVAQTAASVLSVAPRIDPRQHFSAAPATFIEPGVKERYLFSLPVATRLAALSSSIESVPDKAVRRLLRVLLGSAAMDVCNATVSGKGRRYRRNWQDRQCAANDLDERFQALVSSAVYDAARYAHRKVRSYTLMRGDARTAVEGLSNLDLVVCSPPYANSFDYTDVYNVELWALGYLKTKQDNAALRCATLRSHVQVARDLSFHDLPLSVIDLVSRLRACSDLWDKRLPDMVGAYFDDLSGILERLLPALRSRGRVYFVVGDSRYAGVDVPVANLLSEVATNLGYRVLSNDPFRDMRASPQQGGRPELRESLLVLQKD